MKRWLTEFGKPEGQAMVEMALVLPVLLILVFGIIEFGNVFGAYVIVNNLAREGARYGVVGHTDTEIQNYILSGKGWLESADMDIDIAPGPAFRTSGAAMTVSIDYPVYLLTPVLSEVLPNPVQLSGQCIMRVE